ncbi:hypothetical protein BVRB_9g206440 [Beta vulgaris subsp. vulgaris]|uniref:Uncharacterized protein n=1 Tax=Beta vulgaris subsp. vulgaris TaxID=3555 RepID=A0A0J8EGX9_BETVV|nr:hypothetical protein BVRB_9g206440 [Beta vulgaris subsp. vulgaris]
MLVPLDHVYRLQQSEILKQHCKSVQLHLINTRIISGLTVDKIAN